jgi:hypothetical protein
MSRPVTAYITFETEEGAERAKALKDGEIGWLGQFMNFKAPAEPTDIIWENRQYTEKDRGVRLLGVLFLTCLLLFVTFGALFFLKKLVQNSKYASSVNCKDV